MFKDGVARVLPRVLLPVRLITSHYPFLVQPSSPFGVSLTSSGSFARVAALERRDEGGGETERKICQDTAVNSLKLALINERYVVSRANFRPSSLQP